MLVSQQWRDKLQLSPILGYISRPCLKVKTKTGICSMVVRSPCLCEVFSPQHHYRNPSGAKALFGTWAVGIKLNVRYAFLHSHCLAHLSDCVLSVAL